MRVFPHITQLSDVTDATQRTPLDTRCTMVDDAMYTRLSILAFLECCDCLVVSAWAGQVKHPDGFVVARPQVASLPVNGHAVGSGDLICCIIGSVHASQTACAGVPQVYRMSLQQLQGKPSRRIADKCRQYHCGEVHLAIRQTHSTSTAVSLSTCAAAARK